MGMLHKMEEVWWKNSLFDGFNGLHGGYGVGQRNLELECYWRFVWRWTYVCEIHGLRQRTRGR